MSIEGCPHGPIFITGGPGNCTGCIAERERQQIRLSVISQQVQALKDDLNSAQQGKEPVNLRQQAIERLKSLWLQEHPNA